VPYSSHFTIINLAYQKKISGDLERFKEYTYPRIPEEKVANKIENIKSKIAELN
jgi:hypothetical protein